MSRRIDVLLSGLGKATKRGVRNCPKCGTINGTRGLSCKNRSCDMVFKLADTPKASVSSSQKALLRKGSSASPHLECCRLITDSGPGRRLFSVRNREAEGEELGFVLLFNQAELVSADCFSASGNIAFIRSELSLSDSLPDPEWPSHDRCFVSGCCKSAFQMEDRCPHMVVCQDTVEENVSQPLRVKHSVLNQMSIGADLKHEIWLCARKNGPLVQRVSTTTMVVKCRPDERHPLGYLFVTFHSTRTEPRMWCSCESQASSGSPGLGGTKRIDDFTPPCIHFYACIAVFASDEKLSEEFGFFIALQHELADNSLNQVITLLGQDENGETIHVEVLDEDHFNSILANEDSNSSSQVLDADLLYHNNDDIHIEMSTPDGGIHLISLPTTPNADYEPKVVPKKKRQQTISSQQQQQLSRKKPPLQRLLEDLEPVDESTVNLSFVEWLSSVTERINQSMHFQFNGRPDPLVFHAPQTFFNCLRERMSTDSGKKRLPNFTSTFESKDTLPLGTFTKYTWKIVNVLQLKKIFDTPLMQLEVSRKFVETSEGTYEYEPDSSVQLDFELETLPTKKRKKLLKPQELRTFLKAGQMSANQSDCYAFLIEWIPDVLPLLKIGELRLTFEYGHQRNGLVDKEKLSKFQLN